MHLATYLFYFTFICTTINATLIKCNKYKLNNGRVRMKPNSKFARFYCQRGYMLIGTKYGGCINGYFDTHPPICVNNKPNCKKIAELKNGLTIPEANNVVVHFFCKPGYSLIGPNVTICDGNNWLFQTPNCQANGTEPETSCDFEGSDICGWSHDLNHDFDWKRTNSETPTPETGPRFDHTKGPQQNGHYMYVESTSRSVNDSSRLISPIYPQMSQICVSFYYHMYGKAMGTLNVYVKQENERFDRLRARFSVSGNQGDFWHLGRVSLENGTATSFQVIFEGLRGTSYFSDIAIDDVSIDEDACPEEALQTTETSEMPFLGSCLNRCGQNVTNFDDITMCSCEEYCFELNLCCADFIQYCLLGTSIDYDDVLETSTTELLTSELSTSSETTGGYTTIDVTTMPPLIPTFSTKTPLILTYSTTEQPIEITETSKMTFPKINVKFFTEPTIQTPTTDKTTSTQQKTTPQPETTSTEAIQEIPQIATDFLTTQQPDVQYLQQNTKIATKSNDLFLYIGVFVSAAFVMIFVVFSIVFVRRNGLNCKKFTASRNTDSLSDVRFLTTDEVLDFTWKRADSL